jgi:hypothetical protein
MGTIQTEVIEYGSAVSHLNRIGMTLGNWHRIEYLNTLEQRGSGWRKLEAPSDAQELLVFSQKLLEWLPNSREYLVVFDDSTHLDAIQLVALQSILSFTSDGTSNILQVLLLRGDRYEVRARFSYFVFFCLIFGAHLYVVDPTVNEGPILGVIDGASYFICKSESTYKAEEFVGLLQKNTRESPLWITQFPKK